MHVAVIDHIDSHPLFKSLVRIASMASTKTKNGTQDVIDLVLRHETEKSNNGQTDPQHHELRVPDAFPFRRSLPPRNYSEDSDSEDEDNAIAQPGARPGMPDGNVKESTPTASSTASSSSPKIPPSDFGSPYLVRRTCHTATSIRPAQSLRHHDSNATQSAHNTTQTPKTTSISRDAMLARWDEIEAVMAQAREHLPLRRFTEIDNDVDLGKIPPDHWSEIADGIRVEISAEVEEAAAQGELTAAEQQRAAAEENKVAAGAMKMAARHSFASLKRSWSARNE